MCYKCAHYAIADNQHVKSVILGLYQPKVTKNQSYTETEPKH